LLRDNESGDPRGLVRSGRSLRHIMLKVRILHRIRLR
jgi:hypothetical protein